MRLGVLAALAGLALAAVPVAAQERAPDPAASAPRPAPPGLQFLYGSGEAAAMSRQIYRAMERHALDSARQRPAHGVILAEGASLAEPAWAACGDKPLAAVFDIDETVSLNTALMHGRAARTPPAPGTMVVVRPVPGAVEAIRALAEAGITPIYNTNRTTDMAALVADTVADFGLARPVVGETLFLNGFDALAGNKDGRRSHIAANWCVVAMAGDQLGDFSELLNEVPGVAERRAAALQGPVGERWGNGWFLLPNTAYGTALAGTLDEVFPELATTPQPLKEATR